MKNFYYLAVALMAAVFFVSCSDMVAKVAMVTRPVRTLWTTR